MNSALSTRSKWASTKPPEVYQFSSSRKGSEVYLSYVLSLNSGLSTSFSIAKEGIQAAYLTNQVNKERVKRWKDVQEQR